MYTNLIVANCNIRQKLKKIGKKYNDKVHILPKDFSLKFLNHIESSCAKIIILHIKARLLQNLTQLRRGKF